MTVATPRFDRTLSRPEMSIVDAIRLNGPHSRTELARMLDYSRASMTGYVNRLLSAQIVREIGQGRSGGGRRPSLLDLNSSLGYLAGVDIGATSLNIALADFQGRILSQHSEPADVRVEPEALLAPMAEKLSDMLRVQGATPDRLIALGIGVPGPVEFSAARLIAPPLMPLWDGFSIRDYLQEIFPLANTVVDNDVNIMAVGEKVAGAGKPFENFLFIKIGTGIGAGIVANGQIYRGSNGCAGDIGHICVDYNGPICHCGNQGCLEAMAGGLAIGQRGQRLAAAGQSAFLAERLAKNGQVTSIDVGEAAAFGDTHANALIKESGRMIGGVLASLVNFYNPEAIFIGGGVTRIGHRLLSSIRQATLRRSNPLSTRDLRVEYSQLGEDAAVQGAIALALKHVFVLDES
ncbi:MAG: ROK family transcriptional regulator [Ardenticatenaceae bacterium]|nr:ROK family transcriptional regulator [Ardenticatenaceae bacterium]